MSARVCVSVCVQHVYCAVSFDLVACASDKQPATHSTLAVLRAKENAGAHTHAHNDTLTQTHQANGRQFTQNLFRVAPQPQLNEVPSR